MLNERARGERRELYVEGSRISSFSLYTISFQGIFVKMDALQDYQSRTSLPSKTHIVKMCNAVRPGRSTARNRQPIIFTSSGIKCVLFGAVHQRRGKSARVVTARTSPGLDPVPPQSHAALKVLKRKLKNKSELANKETVPSLSSPP